MDRAIGVGDDRRYRLADLTVDAGQRRVTRRGVDLKLGNLTFDLLLALVEAGPNVATYKQLGEKVWSGRSVAPDTITQRVLMLRRDLSDSAEHPKYVEAVRARGYRLKPRVIAVSDKEYRTRIVRYGLALAGVAVLISASLVIRSPFDPLPDATLSNSIAVLPFENLSPQPEDSYLSSEIHQEVLMRLGRLSGLTVIARSSVLQYAGTEKPIVEIARELRVENVMTGSIRFADDEVRLNVELIQGSSGAQLWAETYKDRFSEIFEIQTNLVTNVADALDVEITSTERQALDQAPTEVVEAYSLLMEARNFRSHDVAQWERILDHAIALDPQYSELYAERAANWVRLLRGTASDWESRVERDTRIALELDPTLTTALMARALLLAGKWQWDEAEAAFQKANQLYPDDPDVLFNYGRFKRQTGDYAGSADLLKRLSAIDPWGEGPLQLGITYKYWRRYEQAARAFMEARRGYPALASLRIHIADVEISRGNPDEALSQLQFFEDLPPPAITYRLGQLMLSYSRLGLTEDVERTFSRLQERSEREPVGNVTWAYAYLALGDRDRAARYLELAIDNRLAIDTFGLNSLLANPWDLTVLNTPRFRALRARIPPAGWERPEIE